MLHNFKLLRCDFLKHLTDPSSWQLLLSVVALPPWTCPFWLWISLLLLICSFFLKAVSHLNFYKESSTVLMELYNGCSSFAKLCLTLCDPMDCSMPGLPVLYYLRVHSDSCPLSRWCHPTMSSSVAPFSSCPQSFPATGSFPVSQLFTSGGQSVGTSASALVLPVNIQGWFPLGLTGLLSLLSKGLFKSLLQDCGLKASVLLHLPF